MTDTLQVQSCALSRRTIVLRGVACAAGATALLAPARYAHAAKFPQTSPVVAYQDSPKDSHQCDGCIQWQPPNACQVVDGTISPSGWCKLWAKKAG
jgi:hypothetical protein